VELIQLPQIVHKTSYHIQCGYQSCFLKKTSETRRSSSTNVNRFDRLKLI
jgi:hypothetical protein